VVNGIAYPFAGAKLNMKVLRFFNLKIRMESADSSVRLQFEPISKLAVHLARQRKKFQRCGKVRSA
jgi:hypothetical protein